MVLCEANHCLFNIKQVSNMLYKHQISCLETMSVLIGLRGRYFEIKQKSHRPKILFKLRLWQFFNTIAVLCNFYIDWLENLKGKINMQKKVVF